MFGNTRPFSYSPRGLSLEDFPQQRRPFQQDDYRGVSLQRNSMSRPSGRSIYMQRKEYSETLNKQSDNFYFRVEHLMTCELDGRELKTVADCVAKLKRLDAKGRLWPQEMIMEVQGGYLLLNDIETKVELESLPLSYILQSKAVLDSCAYNSVLTITVQERNKRVPQVYMFQCEETGAELLKSDLDKAVKRGDGDVEPRRETSDIRTNLENILGQHTSGSFRQFAPAPMQQERTPTPPYLPPPQWRDTEAMMNNLDLHELQRSPEVPLIAEQADRRNTEIFNHILSDLEIFMGKVTAAVNNPSLQKDKSGKKKKKKSKKNAPLVILPLLEEYISCLQKIKYGFNLLAQLEDTLTNPTAPDYVHILFTSLGQMVPLYPANVPSTVHAPLLTVAALQLLGQNVNPQEEDLWKSLGDCWSLPRSGWPEDVPPYTPEFYGGWQPPPPSQIPSPLPYQSRPQSRSSSQHFPSGQNQFEEPVTNGQWGPPPPSQPSEPPLNMRVIYDFMARNNQELSIMKGEVVQVIQKSKQWWLIRNSRGEEGNVPQNVLEPMRSNGMMENPPRDTRGSVTLDMTSTPAEVTAWLEYKGFSRLTVNSLGVLTGKLLLGMSKDEIRTVCPEEGGKVFFQLQAVKSAIALASEPFGMYNGRY